MAKISVPDASLHYERSGDGSPVLFIQGVGVAGSGWGPQVEELSRDFDCLVFDNRGIGRSSAGSAPLSIKQMAQDAAALIECQRWASAHVVGHSMGGLIAQQLALQATHLVTSLSLLCTFSRGAEAARLTPQVLWMGLRTRIGTRLMRRRAVLEMLFPEEFRITQDPDVLAARLAPVLGRDLADNPPILMKQLAAMRVYDRTGELPGLSSIPTLVASAYVEIPQASHGVTLQCPHVVNELLRSHFQRAEQRRDRP